MASVGSGTKTADGTNQELQELTSASGTYVLKVNMINLVATESVILRLYDKVISTDSYGIVFEQSYTYESIGNEKIQALEPWLASEAIKVTLEQDSYVTSYKDFPWNLVKV